MTTAQLTNWMKRNPIAMGAGALSLALIVAIVWRHGAVPEANATLEAKSNEARKYELNLTNANQLKEQYDAIAAANKEIEARLIRPSELGINQAYFYRLESEYGVKLADLRQDGRAQPRGSVQSLGFTLNVQGDFPAVIAFLQALERGPHYCRVLTAGCSGTPGGPVTLVLGIELLSRP